MIPFFPLYSALLKPCSFTVVPTGRLDIFNVAFDQAGPALVGCLGGLALKQSQVKFENPGSRAAQ
jgi:hypothetical protein